ncbi:DUF4123 domain-containing protein [Rhizobium deserti]|uniref:DUF4123 domain-containing protein n=1 Tax=Rhizobium deserti TaxID=2547961 RepID=A0A4R5U692_9HYPH|nr:DUF4123 domain-containing protein [Rhizobium deserti]TDK29600.1 DUF4123 domain-containing protein [Rhizobium deserti]
MSNTLKARILDECRPEKDGTSLYVLVDPSRNPALLTTAQALSEEGSCLFLGDAKKEFEDDAPWLFRCGDDGELVRYLIEEGLGKRWAVLIESDQEFPQLFTHLRKFVKIVDGDEDQIFWRFYDPFVIASQLPFMTSEQRLFFFSGMRSLGVEMGGKAFVRYACQPDGRLHTRILEAVNDTVESSENDIADVREIPTDLAPIRVEGARVRPMMHFTQSQIDAPLLYNRPALVEHILETLDDDFRPSVGQIDQQVLDQMISHGVSLAMFSYRIQDVEHIELFIDFMFRIAPGWHREPRLNQVLRADLSSAAKFERLADDDMASAWDDAETYDDHREWLPAEIAAQVDAKGDVVR